MCIIFIITPSKVQTTESGNKTAKRKIIIFFLSTYYVTTFFSLIQYLEVMPV